ncbi:Hypothetical protein, putative [Bodo saltans]|uniref:Membrane-associated protein n=1 Tax=Bodo saltans TaxID=75058 RepID=A0A0S4IQN4_BODSA|nr:Hypothetical protein, putative [Bodo saltans]|eukprot:CUE92155.1 Hypothetical protein, putative [Bodo saltans]
MRIAIEQVVLVLPLCLFYDVVSLMQRRHVIHVDLCATQRFRKMEIFGEGFQLEFVDETCCVSLPRDGRQTGQGKGQTHMVFFAT